MKVPDCPICRSPGTLNRRQGTIYCSNAECAFCHFNLREKDWNELCALVEKGRKCDEAVELLRMWRKLYPKERMNSPLQSMTVTTTYFGTDQFLARIDKGGGE